MLNGRVCRLFNKLDACRYYFGEVAHVEEVHWTSPAPNPVLALFTAFLTSLGVLQVVALIRSDTRWGKLSDLPIIELAGFVGLILIALLLARSLVSDLWNGLAHEKRIVCGSGQAGTSYDYHSLLSRNPKEVIVVAQNMRTLLSDKDYLPSISAWLARNKDLGASLTFILSTPKLLSAHSGKAKEHLRQSVIDLKGFLEKEPLREKINRRRASESERWAATREGRQGEER